MRTGRVSLGLVAIAGGLVALWAVGASGSSKTKGPVTAIHPDSGELVTIGSRQEGQAASSRTEDAEGCQLFASDPTVLTEPFSRRSIFRGNLYEALEDSVLTDFGVALSADQPASTNIYFEIYRRPVGESEYTQVGNRVVRTMVEAGCADGFCMRGTSDGSVNFEAGFEYALGVSWGPTTITYFTQDLPLPRDFDNGDGSILGSLALPASGSPPDIEPFTPSFFTGTEYKQRLCFEPKPGACCIPPAIDGDPGTCTSLLQTDCEAAGGEFQGQKVACEPGLCRFGACCSDCGECTPSLTPTQCQADNGTWQGANVACRADPAELCETVTGACCTGGSIGTCTDLCEEDCVDAGGIYHGDGTECGPDQTGPCKGACCRSNECRDATPDFCNGALNGTYKGDGTRCATLPASLQCGGACCFGSLSDLDACIIVDELNDCSDNVLFEANPSYLGDGTNCPADCNPQGECVGGANHGRPCEIDAQCPDGACDIPPDPYGACCTASGLCINTTEDFCTDHWGAASFNIGQKCPTPIDPPLCSTGACCLSDGSCEDVTSVYCTGVLGGVFTPATDCAQTTCTGPLGACCTELGCVDAVGRNSCEAADDLFLGVGSVCGLDSCPVGACCQPTGDCLDTQTPAQCATVNGTYVGDLTTCEIADCVQPGWCCAQTGTCLPGIQQTECENNADINGVFSAALNCGDACAGGACCLPDETCAVRSEDACLAEGGTYQGDDTTCTGIGGDAACVVGVCCSFTKGCLDPALALECGDAQDDFNTTPGASCGTFIPPCEQAGGCCMRDGGCTNMTLTACGDATGSYLGDGNFCEDVGHTCPATGSCCRASNDCDEDRFETECMGIGDLFNDGVTCGNADCPQASTGACCLDAFNCEIRTALDCRLLTGTDDAYQGDSTSCLAAECEPSGVCCRFSGLCTNSLLSQCPPEIGNFHEGVTCGEVECGACCRLDETCSDGTLGSDCQGDVRFSQSFSCIDDDVCDPFGACCIDGACELRGEFDCQVIQSGLYLGDGVSCNDVDCTEGGCCRTDGSCETERIESQCDGPNEVFTPGDNNCGGNCVAVGACCTPAGTCLIESQSNCEGAGGLYGGDASTCTQDLCATGACCDTDFAGPTCNEIFKMSCDLSGGEFAGADTTCPTNACDRGSCCRADGSCDDDATRLSCNGAIDLFTDGRSCDAAVCSSAGTPCITPAECPIGETCDPVVECVSRGACCLPDESCEILSAVACSAAGGAYSGEGVDCSLENMCVIGACCATDGSCDDTTTTRFDCEQAGGSYVGPGAVCETDICIVGACCAGDGSCTDDVRAPRCDGTFDTFNAAMQCVDVTCPVREANYLSSIPDSSEPGNASHGESLWRTERGVIRLTFDADITAPLAGEIEIRELLDGGAFGGDLSASFSLSVENDGGGDPRVLRIADTGSTIGNDKWYAITNIGGWAGVAGFERHFASAFGDASGDAIVQFSDLSLINANVNQPVSGDDDRSDINGDNLIQFTDLAAANATIGTDATTKPTGH